jgi:cell shape-determining protein MreC
LRLLEEENRKLKKLVADQALDNMVLKELLGILKPKARRTVMTEIISRFGLPTRRFCRLTGWNRFFPAIQV